MPGVEQLDIVVTAGVLASGFHERIHQYWPGLDEVDGAPALGFDASVTRPRIHVPPQDSVASLWYTCRDREEELVRLTRQLKGRGDEAPDLDRVGVVFRHPLPYLYLAADTFDQAGLAYQSIDELPQIGRAHV